MNLDTVYQILALVFSGGSVLSVISAVMWRKYARRSKEAEARLAEVQAQQAGYDYEKKRIDDLHKIIDLLNTQLLAAQKLAGQKEDIITDKTARIREKDGEISTLNEALRRREQFIAAQQRFIDWLKNWHCRREYGNGKEDCRRRKPEQRIKVSYDPPAEMEECDLPPIPDTDEETTEENTHER